MLSIRPELSLLVFLSTLVACIAVDISLESQSVDILIKDRYASINYTFYFVNNNNDNPSELSFEISLQPHTFISYFTADLNGDLYRGKTKEASQAQAEYNDAVESGLNAVLVSQDHDANVFNVETNIENNGYAKLQIVAETFMLRRFGYYELSLLITNVYSYAINTVFTSTDIVINLYDESAISYVDIVAPSNANYNIYEISSNSYNIDATLQKSESTQQQLILLRYKTERMDDMNQLLYDEESLTFMHIFSYEDEYTVLPRRVVFVLDRSGSMGTSKWNAAVSATIGAIQNLNDADRMNVILFDSSSIFFKETIVSVTSDIKTDCVNWINGYTSGGSTNLYQGVIDALHLIESDTTESQVFAYVNQVILVTDGQPTAGVTDPTLIQEGFLDANDNLEPAPAAIFCLAIGDDYGNDWVTDLNYPLLRSIATQNGGFDVRVKESETETVLNEYYNILESPVLSYIVLYYASYASDITNTNEAEMVTQNEFRQLYAGTDIVSCGKVADAAITGFIISLFAQRGDEAISTAFPITPTNDADNDDIVIDRVWAYLRLQMYRDVLDNPLLDMVLLGNAFETLALNLALEYEFVTPWTSMIVVDDAVDGNITDSINIDDSDVMMEGDMDMGAYYGSPPSGGYYYYYSNGRYYDDVDGDYADDESTSDHTDLGIVHFSNCIYYNFKLLVFLSYFLLF